MRILQLNKYYAEEVGGTHRIGGVEKVVHQLSTGLVDRGMCVRVLASHHGVHLRDSVENVDGVRVRRCGTLGFVANTPISPSYVFDFRRLVRWADVLHFHVPSPLPEITRAVLDGVAPRTTIVSTFHADPVRTRLGYLSGLYAPVLRSLLSASTRIAVTAPANLDSPSLASVRDKCRVIPLAAVSRTPARSPSDDEEMRRALGIDLSMPIVLFVGRLAYYKGLEHLIRAMVDVPAVLVIVGTGELRPELEQLAVRVGVDNRIRFEGFVADEALTGYYETADLFVLPSISPAEAFGIVQIEAMRSGLPVVNTCLESGVPFVSRHGETGLTVPPSDSDALSTAIRRILGNPDLKRRLSQAARKRSEEFTVSKMVDRYLELYEASP